ncbi:hypothetical protein TIFTF001_015895 [Ficus carica]|uniref:Bifunctional inhibitor/plant lipid transfer protein/seed storage helical domain-containing protein n=1 Tax=Ficus carica TaxID=3494 RepID=A0AA88D5L7_FICCA|nr:hypothetical protein TIFTF001_015895 [Ficus carica]
MAFPAHSSPLIALVVISVLLHSAMAPLPPPAPAPAPAPASPSHSPASECVNELVMFSPCLSFVSSPPNNLSGTVPSKCCDAVWVALNSGEGSCLCYLLRQPRILGFPLDKSRVLSLPSVCSLTDPSLEALCSGSESEAVSPDSGILNPPHSAPSSQPSPSMDLPLESDNSTTPLSSPPDASDSGTKSSPPPQFAERLPTGSISPAADPLFSFPAAANRLKGSRFWFQTSIWVFPSLIFTCL